MGNRINNIETWLSKQFPEIDLESRAIITSHAEHLTLPKGSEVFHVGDACEQFFFLLNGVSRVQLVSESGREIVSYRIQPGDTCVLTTACLLGHIVYNAEAITESDAAAIVLPQAAFSNLIELSDTFRTTVFLFARRLTDVVSLLEGVAFHGIDARLAQYLLVNCIGGELNTTHAKIAADLGAAREVFSRHLKNFAKSGIILAEPSHLKIIDDKKMQLLARGL